MAPVSGAGGLQLLTTDLLPSHPTTLLQTNFLVKQRTDGWQISISMVRAEQAS